MALSNRDLEPGTILAARYKKETYRCEVVAGEDGKTVYRLPDGREFSSPSAAGSAVMGGVACNGWRFWSLEGDLPAAKEPKAKAAPRAKAPKAKGKAKPKLPKTEKVLAKKRAAKASANGSDPIACGECGQEFPTSREAADHMRDEHGSVEAPGSGGR